MDGNSMLQSFGASKLGFLRDGSPVGGGGYNTLGKSLQHFECNVCIWDKTDQVSKKPEQIFHNSFGRKIYFTSPCAVIASP
jgi:hypothetical protein